MKRIAATMLTPMPYVLTVKAVGRGFGATVCCLALVVLAGNAGALRGEESPHAGAAHGETSHEQAVEHGVAAHGEADHHEPTPMHHVMDPPNGSWDFFHSLPSIRQLHLPVVFGFQITQYMILELIAALLIIVIYVPLARRVQTGEPVRGGWGNAFEVLLTFIRDEVAKPSIGEHDADRFVPFLWTLFLFILFNNLLGVIPFGNSATASIYVTGALALVVFVALHGSAIAKMGFGHYIKSMWPHMEVPFGLGYVLKPMVFALEWLGVLVRNGVLAVRLFANMFAGHMVLATLLVFIYAARNLGSGLWGSITLASVLGIVALSLLEIFVAFLQAYIFVFLTALFMGMAMHPQH